MHAYSNSHYSVVDLHFMRLDTNNGRAQIREQLEEGFHVPAEVVFWFFEEIDARDLALEELKQQFEAEP